MIKFEKCLIEIGETTILKHKPNARWYECTPNGCESITLSDNEQFVTIVLKEFYNGKQHLRTVWVPVNRVFKLVEFE